MAIQMMDLGLNTGNDLAIVNGDLVITESTRQHQVQLLQNDKGDFKENPVICVGVDTYLDDDDIGGLAREINKQFLQDGMEQVNETQANNFWNLQFVYQ